MNVTRIPREVLSERLLFRPWQNADAVLLLPVLEANVAHLGDWIPAHVSAPAPLSELELRLAGFRNDFDAGRNWRFAVFPRDQSYALLFRSRIIALPADCKLRQ
jgi:hypothetical protein